MNKLYKNIKPVLLNHLFKVPPKSLSTALGPQMTYRFILRGVGDMANRNTPIAV